MKSIVRAHCGPARLRDAEASSAGWMPDLWEDFVSAGLVGVGVTDQAGGTPLDAAVIAYEIGRGLAPIPFVETGVLGAGAFAACGLPVDEILSGSAIVVPVSGSESDPIPYASIATSVARVDRSAEWLLLADRPVAPRVPVLGPEPCGVIENAAWESVVFNRHQLAMIQRVALVTMAARAVGAMSSAIDYAVEYVRTRRQFGRSIGSFQAVQHQLADSEISRELAGAAVATAVDSDSLAEAEAAVRVSLVGYRDVARTVCQVLGGYGFTEEYDAQIHFRTASSWLIYHSSRFTPGQLLNDAASFLASKTAVGMPTTREEKK